MTKTIRTLLWGAAAVALIVWGALALPDLLGAGDIEPSRSPEPSTAAPAPTPTPDPEQEVRDLTGAFGARLKDVSLTAPVDDVRESIRESYGPFVSPELLTLWLDDPAGAPGRLVSSPWPDRIDIRSVSAVSDTDYEIKGDIIEVTSAEADTGDAAARRPVTLHVAQVAGEWRISSFAPGPYEDLSQVVYTNDQYGFRFSLPGTWEGYSIITDTWAGFPAGDEVASETGPLIFIRHPLWTEDTPRQDIPIMVFTAGQWEALQAEAFHVGAAPIGPSELGRNAAYVFALPARYNFEYLTGYEEVDAIFKGDPLEPVEPAPSASPEA